MTRYGYARVSSIGQSLEIQIADLNNHACEMIRQEKLSGTKMDNRPELNLLLEFMRTGDQLFVTRLDRLARSTEDLCRIVAILEKKGCTLHCTQQNIETQTPTGRLMVQLLGAFAEFETALRKERQMAGIAAAKERGVYSNVKRTPTFDPDEIRRLYHHNVKPRAIAKRLQCSPQTVYRVLKGNINDARFTS